MERGAHNSSIRRRGDFLEADILQAAWDELSDVGYTRLTMEGVAVRAKTSKTVIYRRWPNRAELILAAIRHRGPILTGEVPNTGSLRTDLLSFLNRVAKRMQEIGFETIHGLVAEIIGDNSVPAFFDGRQVGFEMMCKILRQATERGEIREEKMSPRVVSLPVDLVRHEILTTHDQLSETAITEIVDDIFLPLIQGSRRP